jgi:hypothetical protein
MEKFPNEVDNISTKDASSFQEVKNKFFNLPSAGGNSDSAHHTFSKKKNTKLKKGTKSSGLACSKPPFSFSMDIASTKVETCMSYTKYYLLTANSYSWYKCSKLNEFNKLLSKHK